MTQQEYNSRSLHEYQERLADEAAQILARSDHAYLEAPTGTGKTLIVAHTAQKIGLTNVIYIANSLDLLSQAKAEISALIYGGEISTKINWEFMTWLRYSSIARRSPELFPQEGHLAVVDECHIGGVKDTFVPKTAFPAIRAHSTKVLWVSATPWELDEDVMGERAENTAYYSFEQAYLDGRLNPTEVIRVDCSLNLTVQVSDEVENIKDLYRAEGAPLSVSGISADATFDQLSAYVRDLANRELRTTDVPALVEFRWRLMAELYLKKHMGQKCIFWLPSKAHARACADYLRTASNDSSFAAAILGETRGSTEREKADAALANWRNPVGTIKVACVVYRLREGFNYPHLAVGFDCSWNPYNYRNTIQKIGRLLRPASGKPPSSYYYAVDAVSIAAASRRFSDVFFNKLSGVYKPEDLTISARAMADIINLRSTITGVEESITKVPIVKTNLLRGQLVTEAGSPLFDVIGADGVALGERYTLKELFELGGADRAELLVSDILSGKTPCPGISERSPESLLLRRYLTPSYVGFRKDWYEKLVEAGYLVPNSARKAAATARVELHVKEIIAGTRPWPSLVGKTPESKSLRSYLTPSHPSFRKDLYDQLIAAKILIPPTLKKIQAEERIEAYLSSIERKELTMDFRKDAYNYLFKYFNPSNKTFRPDVRKRLIAAGAIKEYRKIH